MKRYTYTPEDIAYIKEHFATSPTADIAKHLNVSPSAISYKAHMLGLKKDESYLNSPACHRMQKGSTLGSKTRFKKGTVPPNKGKKQSEYMSPEAIERTKPTQFKKGQLPHNAKQDGVISTRRNVSGRKYKWIRISLGHWVELHRHEWEQTYGPIPKGFNIVFKDGNSLNCDIDNLQMVTNDELMYKNTIMRYPPEMRRAFRLIGKLTRKINEHGK